MKKLVSLILACLLLASLCACSSEPTLVSTTPDSDITTEPTAPDNNITTEPTTTNEDKVFKPGDTVELNDVTVTFIGITESTGEQFIEPAEGKIFVLCEFEISNNSSEELSVSSMLSFEAYCDDYSCEYSLSALLAKGSKEQLDGSVAPGKKMKGVIGYEIPTDWKELEIQYTPDLFSNDKIVFTAENS